MEDSFENFVVWHIPLCLLIQFNRFTKATNYIAIILFSTYQVIVMTDKGKGYLFRQLTILKLFPDN